MSENVGSQSVYSNPIIVGYLYLASVFTFRVCCLS